MHEMFMPRVDAGMEEGTILKWLKKEGDPIKKDEPIVEIEAEKATTTLTAPIDGILYKIIAKEGETVPVGKTICIIREPGEELPKEGVEKTNIPSVEVETKKEIISSETHPAEKPKPQKECTKASPLARNLAKQYGIDLSKIKGTGPGGRIVKRDILKAVEELKEAKKLKKTETKEMKEGAQETRNWKEVPLNLIRRRTAERMSFSHREIPPFALTVEVDVSELLELRKEIENETNTKISITAFLIKAVALALREYPVLNASFEDGHIKVYEDININVAIATSNGLVVPVIHNADKLALGEIASRLKELIEKAQNNKLDLSDVAGGTFTISNLGPYGVDIFIPIINPPQAAILGVGRVKEKVTVVNDKVAVKPTMTLSLVVDHRVVDGAPAAQFLQALKHYLEKPVLLLIS